jgi:hypothetical protein
LKKITNAFNFIVMQLSEVLFRHTFDQLSRKISGVFY